MNFHFFSDPEFAGPGPGDIVKFWDRTPRQLRPKPRRHVPKLIGEKFTNLMPVTIAKQEDALKIATFWNSYYTGPDWRFKCNGTLVGRAIKSGVIMVIWNNERAPIATFVCRFLPKGIVCGSYNSQVGLLEGLVIHPEFRGSGLASYMLVAMDNYIYNLPNMSQSILMWFREHSSPFSAMIQTPCTVLNYYYAKISQIPKSKNGAGLVELDFVESVVKTIYDSHKLTIMSVDCSDPDVLWYLAESTLVGIADTHRYSESGDALWEVVFAANLSPPYFTNLEKPILACALVLPSQNGIIFASTGLTRGNFGKVDSPWVSGRAGCLTMHVYNWMPPALLSGDILFPHSCI